MTYHSTLKCSLTPTGQITGEFVTSGLFKGDFFIPERVETEHYYGPYEFTPSWEEQTGETANKFMEDDILVHPIQYYETSNEAGGITFII